MPVSLAVTAAIIVEWPLIDTGAGADDDVGIGAPWTLLTAETLIAPAAADRLVTAPIPVAAAVGVVAAAAAMRATAGAALKAEAVRSIDISSSTSRTPWTWPIACWRAGGKRRSDEEGGNTEEEGDIEKFDVGTIVECK